MTCPREGKFIGGCKFEPRYDLGEPDLSEFTKLTASPEALNALRTKTYVKDVCVRCGKTIERKP
jgi:hypothetical protein